MSLAVVVREGDPTPPFRQIFIQMSAAITSGELHAGTKLPSVRTLASDLDLAPGTVMRAYADLASAGLVVSRRGRGSVVADGAADPQRHEQIGEDLVRDFIARARDLGLSDAHIERLVTERLDSDEDPVRSSS